MRPSDVIKSPTISPAGLIPKARVSIEPGGSMVTKAILPLWADANGADKAVVIKVMAKIDNGKVQVLFIFLLPCAGPCRARLMSENLLPHLIRAKFS